MKTDDHRGDVGEIGEVGDQGIVAVSALPPQPGAPRVLIQRGGKLDFGYSFYCPACKCGHYVRTSGPEPTWSFNLNEAAPSFRPSLKISGGGSVCHLNVDGGHLVFCPDCTHEFAGKTVPMVDWDTIV